MTSLTDRAERRRIAKLEKRVVDFDLAISAAEGDLSDLGRREAALAERLAREEAKRPVETAEAEEAAADALLADPDASTVTWMDRLTGARSKREKTLTDWRASLKPIKDAIGLAQRKQEKAKQEVGSLRKERDAAWNAFAAAAVPALMAELEGRLLVLHDEVFAPLAALRKSAPMPIGTPWLDPVEGMLSIKKLWQDGGYIQSAFIFPRTKVETRGSCSDFQSPTTGPFPVGIEPYLDQFRAELRAERG